VFSADGRLFLLPKDRNPTDGAFIRVYETATGRFVRQLNMPDEFFASAIFMPDGKHLLTSAAPLGQRRQWTFRLWDLETGMSRQLDQIKPPGWPCSTSVSRDGKRLKFQAADEWCVLELETGRVLLREPFHDGKVSGIWDNKYLSDDGRWLMSVTNWTATPSSPWKQAKSVRTARGRVEAAGSRPGTLPRANPSAALPTPRR
jgi:WD40 repeat protein